MSFLSDLENGAPGLRLELPPHVEIKKERDKSVEAVSRETGLTWHATLSPWPIGLPEDEDQLRHDVRASTTTKFDESFDPSKLPGLLQKTAKPKTAEDGWSPVIEAQTIEVGGGVTAVRMVYRVYHQPNLELVHGRLLIPVKDGTFQVTAWAVDEKTGYREQLVLDEHESDAVLTQSDYDHPDVDSKVPQHPLTRVRRALRWLDNPDNLTVTMPAAPPPTGEVELPDTGSSVILPPRFVPVPSGVLPIPPSMIMAGRMGHSAFDLLWKLHIWCVGQAKEGHQSLEHLELMAQKHLEQSGRSAKDGARVDIVHGDGPFGKPAVHTTAVGKGRARIERSRGCWFLWEDGRVYRLGGSCPESFDPAILEGYVDTLIAGWKPMKMKVKGKGKKSWWKFW